MRKFQSIPVLAIAIALSLPTAVHAQNPPMNCAPDGIIEVCTLADTTSTPTAAEVPAPPMPHVTYKDGQLTITAENVPLSEVLREVSSKTGATLEVPPGGAREPVFVNIGPGSVRDVLVKLLNGTKFNYVMTGSQDTSSDLKKLVLTPADQPPEVAQNSDLASPVQVSTPNWPAQSAARGRAGAGPADPQDENAKRQASLERVRRLMMFRHGQQQSAPPTDSPSAGPASQDSAPSPDPAVAGVSESSGPTAAPASATSAPTSPTSDPVPPAQ